eukprot:SAG22_NODE_6265_length_877_cov_3.841902_1_plen_154_part_10
MPPSPLSACALLAACAAPAAALPATGRSSASTGSGGGASALAGRWFGTLSYPASQKGAWLSHNVPFNLTIDVSGQYASMDWTVEHYPATQSYCVPQHEVRGPCIQLQTVGLMASLTLCSPAFQEGMNVTVDSAHGLFFAKGTGTGKLFYSLEAM